MTVTCPKAEPICFFPSLKTRRSAFSVIKGPTWMVSDNPREIRAQRTNRTEYDALINDVCDYFELTDFFSGKSNFPMSSFG